VQNFEVMLGQTLNNSMSNGEILDIVICRNWYNIVT
jgi:hypothetical protein